MDEIIEIIGQPAALKLSEFYGGMTLYIGKTLSDDITQAIGDPAALELARVFDGCQIYIPNAKAAKMALRNNSIRNDRAAGVAIRDLARTHRLSDRRIFSICGAITPHLISVNNVYIN